MDMNDSRNEKMRELQHSLQNDLNSHLVKQRIINHHLEKIEALLDEGYPMTVLFKHLNLNIKFHNFKTMVRRARIKLIK